MLRAMPIVFGEGTLFASSISISVDIFSKAKINKGFVDFCFGKIVIYFSNFILSFFINYY